MEPQPNKDAPVRRRRKITRVHREVTPEGSKVGRRAADSTEEEEESAVSSSTTTTNTQMSRNNSVKSATLSAHKSKILSRRDKAVATQRSQSQPRIELSPPPLSTPGKEKKSTDIFHFMKVARRSLSSPRNKEGSRNASPNPTTNGGRSEKLPPVVAAFTEKPTLELQQLSKLDLNLRRFEEERRKFEIERRKFETERRELDRIRVKGLEERDKKRIAEGYQQLLAKRNAKEESRKASLKASDPEESQRLIESFNKAQETSLTGERKVKKSASKKRLHPNELVPPNTVARRSVSLRRRSSPRPRHSTSDDADDEYGTERKGSDSMALGALPPPQPVLNGAAKEGEKLIGPEQKRSWFTRIFGGKSAVVKKEKEHKKPPKKKEMITKASPLSKWQQFKIRNHAEVVEIKRQYRKCIANTIILVILCGVGGLLFRFSEGALDNFYKCGAKKVKRDFIDQLWAKSHSMREEEWKSLARNKLRTFEEELQNAFESGMSNYSGQKAWSFISSCIFSFSAISTIGYGHIAPATTLGRWITILYSVIGIPIFLIVLADFGKLFTRGIKFLWAYARGLYYTGSCRKVRKTVQVQDMVKGMNIAYDFMRRPSQFITSNEEDDPEKQDEGTSNQLSIRDDETNPQTPMPSEIEIDDEFNLPISLALFILISYILLGAAMYSMWETWSFFESFYFVFISMSTIGFGDYVPNHPIFMMCSIIYLVFGLALTSMCINVVQLKLSDSFRQASSKIRETIGLDAASSMNDTPMPPDLNSECSTAAIETPPRVAVQPAN